MNNQPTPSAGSMPGGARRKASLRMSGATALAIAAALATTVAIAQSTTTYRIQLRTPGLVIAPAGDNGGQTAVAPTLGAFTVGSVTLGGAYTLTPPPSTSPGAWSFSSSNPAVATVSGDQLTPVSVGTTQITATQAAATGFTSASTSATLTVVPPALITPTLGALSVPGEVAVGAADVPLTPPSSNSDGAWSYSSSDPAVAAIVNGAIHAVSPGVATITVTQAATSTYASGSVVSSSISVVTRLVTLSPMTHDFGTVAQNTTGERIFTVSASGTGGLSGVYPELQGGSTALSLVNNTCGTQASPVTVASGANCTFTVRYAPTASGNLSGTSVAVNSSATAGVVSATLTGNSPGDPMEAHK